MKKLSEAAMTFGRIGSQAFDQLVFSGERFDQVLRSIFRQLANQAVFAGLTGGVGSLGALVKGRKMHGGGVVGGIGESMTLLRSGEAVFTPAQTRALGLMASRPSGGISESAMQSAFDKALAKHTSKLGPREIFVLSREGGRAMGRLNSWQSDGSYIAQRDLVFRFGLILKTPSIAVELFLFAAQEIRLLIQWGSLVVIHYLRRPCPPLLPCAL